MPASKHVHSLPSAVAVAAQEKMEGWMLSSWSCRLNAQDHELLMAVCKADTKINMAPALVITCLAQTNWTVLLVPEP